MGCSPDGPGGYVVILFGGECEGGTSLNKCPMTATWFATFDEAEAYMATMPDWTAPHRLPVCTPPTPSITPRRIK